jgi:RNA polymerase sigma-70 factor (ECF subfamily)
MAVSAAARHDTDAAVIEASWRDSEVFALVYDRYAALLYRYAFRRLGTQAAQDAVADTFLAAFQRRHSYDVSRPDARPWLFGILTNEMSRYHRTEAARLRAAARSVDAEVEDGLADRVAEGVSASSARGALAAALAKLGAGDRDVLLLIAWSDLSYEEAASALGIPIGTVRSRLNRARRQIRAALGGVNPSKVTEEL